MGLELKPSKTRITHTLHEWESNIGFDFLAFQVRQDPVGKTQTAKVRNRFVSTPLGLKTIIKPSEEAVHRHLWRIQEERQKHLSQKQEQLRGALNRMIRGWWNYHRKVSARKTFAKRTHLTWLKLMRWAKRRHSNTSVKWRHQKYWPPGETNGNFRTSEGKRLMKHSEFSRTRHIQVRDKKSPYDGDWSYWATRMGKHPELPLKKAKLLKRQHARGVFSGLYFTDGDTMEVDHMTPRIARGKGHLQEHAIASSSLSRPKDTWRENPSDERYS